MEIIQRWDSKKVVKRWLFNFLKNWILTNADENNGSWAT
jgi:hypothetical protein